MAAVAAVLAIGLVGCTPAPALTNSDVIGTWVLEDGGSVIFDEDTVRFDDLSVSPLSGGGKDRGFGGTGTWELYGKSSVHFVLPEFTSLGESSFAGNTYAASLKAIIRNGEIQFDLYDTGLEVHHYLQKQSE